MSFSPTVVQPLDLGSLISAVTHVLGMRDKSLSPLVCVQERGRTWPGRGAGVRVCVSEVGDMES